MASGYTTVRTFAAAAAILREKGRVPAEVVRMPPMVPCIMAATGCRSMISRERAARDKGMCGSCRMKADGGHPVRRFDR